MNKKRVITALLVFLNISVYAQNVMNYVDVPDSIAYQLDSVYYALTGSKHVNAGGNVHNIINFKKTHFENGPYVFGGMGPHFTKMIFINYNTRIYVISTLQMPTILDELNNAYKRLRILDNDFMLYMKYIITYIVDSGIIDSMGLTP